MEEGTLSKWLIKIGDKVNPGDLLAEIETDKATMEVECIEEGYVSDLLVKEGTEGVKINTPIAILSSSHKKIKNDQEIKKNKLEENIDDNVIHISPSKDISELDSLNNNQNQLNNTETHNITVRQALRDAMAEEMRIDKNVLCWVKKWRNIRVRIKLLKVF